MEDQKVVVSLKSIVDLQNLIGNAPNIGVPYGHVFSVMQAINSEVAAQLQAQAEQPKPEKMQVINRVKP
jgi:hypothetical protein